MQFDMKYRGQRGSHYKDLQRAIPKVLRATVRTAASRARRDIIKKARGITRVDKKDRSVSVLVNPRRGVNWQPKARVVSRLLYKGGSRGSPRRKPVDLLTVFDQGAVIRAARRSWLAVPTEHAPIKGGAGSGSRGNPRKATPSEAAQQGMKFRFIPISRNRAVLIYRQRIIYVLIKEVRFKPKLSLKVIAKKHSDKMGTDFVRRLDRELRRIERKFT